jgi:hypothetical protein
VNRKQISFLTSIKIIKKQKLVARALGGDALPLWTMQVPSSGIQTQSFIWLVYFYDLKIFLIKFKLFFINFKLISF